MSSSVPVLSCLLSYTADNLTTTTAAALHINTKALIHQHHQTGAGTRHHQKHGHERNLCTAHRGGRICYLNIVLPMQCFRWLRFTMAGRHGNISATIAKKERKRENHKGNQNNTQPITRSSYISGCCCCSTCLLIYPQGLIHPPLPQGEEEGRSERVRDVPHDQIFIQLESRPCGSMPLPTS